MPINICHIYPIKAWLNVRQFLVSIKIHTANFNFVPVGRDGEMGDCVILPLIWQGQVYGGELIDAVVKFG
ncbi:MULTISPECIES: hypothetical protein [Moraxella]|uniref:Uncharacterized protein n=1 Tax=Moraxella catarrhalis TaxID=480 RepID=A0A7Z0UXW1_MORCA|nr:hypothetical protein [Moraxella catarrhalis]OAV00144.1 hypothetical protein AO382_1622 [Moraxella catarrhalis]